MADPALKVEFEEFITTRVGVAEVAAARTPQYKAARKTVLKAQDAISARLDTDGPKLLEELQIGYMMMGSYVGEAAYRQGMVDGGGLVEILTGRKPAQAGR